MKGNLKAAAKWRLIMRVLENLEPKKVFYYFEEICQIPHGSGNLDRISGYLEQFAKDRGLFHIQIGRAHV